MYLDVPSGATDGEVEMAVEAPVASVKYDLDQLRSRVHHKNLQPNLKMQKLVELSR